jgi:hypothetical protein
MEDEDNNNVQIFCKKKSKKSWVQWNKTVDIECNANNLQHVRS